MRSLRWILTTVAGDDSSAIIDVTHFALAHLRSVSCLWCRVDGVTCDARQGDIPVRDTSLRAPETHLPQRKVEHQASHWPFLFNPFPVSPSLPTFFIFHCLHMVVVVSYLFIFDFMVLHVFLFCSFVLVPFVYLLFFLIFPLFSFFLSFFAFIQFFNLVFFSQRKGFSSFFVFSTFRFCFITLSFFFEKCFVMFFHLFISFVGFLFCNFSVLCLFSCFFFSIFPSVNFSKFFSFFPPA